MDMPVRFYNFLCSAQLSIVFKNIKIHEYCDISLLETADIVIYPGDKFWNCNNCWHFKIDDQVFLYANKWTSRTFIMWVKQEQTSGPGDYM